MATANLPASRKSGQEELEKVGRYRKTILKAPPGITGLWQVSGKNELAFEDRLRLDFIILSLLLAKF